MIAAIDYSELLTMKKSMKKFVLKGIVASIGSQSLLLMVVKCVSREIFIGLRIRIVTGAKFRKYGGSKNDFFFF